jgi:hypothetical protein
MVAATHCDQTQPMENILPRPLTRQRAPLEFWMTGLLVLFLLLLAVRAGLQPVDAATGFGVPLDSALDGFYLRVKGDRDLACALMIAALLWLGERRALGVVVAAATLEPIADCALVIARAPSQLGYALAIHGSAALYAVVLSFLLLRQQRTQTTR